MCVCQSSPAAVRVFGAVLVNPTSPRYEVGSGGVSERARRFLGEKGPLLTPLHIQVIDGADSSMFQVGLSILSALAVLLPLFPLFLVCLLCGPVVFLADSPRPLACFTADCVRRPEHSSVSVTC